MITVNKFVGVYPDGSFLITSSTDTHGGEKIYFSKTVNIDLATTFHNPSPYITLNRRYRDELAKLEVKYLPVKVNKEVVLQAFG